MKSDTAAEGFFICHLVALLSFFFLRISRFFDFLIGKKGFTFRSGGFFGFLGMVSVIIFDGFAVFGKYCLSKTVST